MKPELNRYRLLVLAGICLLIILFATMVSNLLTQVRDLSSADEDNIQWSISQLDIEFANLDAVLTEQIAAQTGFSDQLQLRADIALSRLNVVNSGRAREIYGDSSEAAELIEQIEVFGDDAVAILDSSEPLDETDLLELKRLVRDVRPVVRELALLGVRIVAERSEDRRAELAGQLSRTGGIAVGLLILMALLLLFMDRLLQRSVRRDAALSASSKQLASTVAASLDAIVTSDSSGRIIEFNASAERVFGWARDEIVGLTMEDTFIPQRMRDAHHNGMKRYLETGAPRVVDAGRIELAALRKSGEEFPVELNVTTTHDGDDTKFIAYIRDISERKINEQKLIDARDRAERTDKAKSQFMTVMSHEMRTPLNGILGVLDLLKTTPLNDQQARYTRIATSSSEVLLEHVNEALDITRIETGNLQLNSEAFDLKELMQALVELFEPLANEKNLAVKLDINPAVQGPYHGDSGRIRQVLTNLIGNAIKFTEDGEVTLRVSGIHGPETSSLRFEVIDTGIGIPAEQHEQVFEDFIALANSEGRQARGDGLGLSISRRIARAMGGDVSLKSVEGSGSVFILTLPLRRTEPETRDDSDNLAQNAKLAPSCNILIVEDNSINRSVLCDMLTTMGHTVREAVNGEDCLQKAKDEVFDIILMDISMPVMDGIEATECLRRSKGMNAETHIVGLTAHGREEYRERSVAAGMDRFHTKPIRLEALQNIVAEVTSKHLSKPDTAHFPEALSEMINLLGSAKVANIAEKFLSEIAEFTADLRVASDPLDTLAFAEAAHRAKGAASLLGQIELHDALEKLELDARDGNLTATQIWAETLEAEAAKSKSVLDGAINRHTNTP